EQRGSERRFCDRPLSPGDGSGGYVCDSGGAVFLVSENVWTPVERGARESAFLDDVCRGVCNFHAYALAGTADAVAIPAGGAASPACFSRSFDPDFGYS